MAALQRPSLVESIFNELRFAVQDVRQKVLEEGWFGRAVTPRPMYDLSESDGFNPYPELYPDDGKPIQADSSARPPIEERWEVRAQHEMDAGHEPPGMDVDR